MNHEELIAQIKNKKSIIGVVGLGYVGLPLSIRLSEVGYKVVGFDINENQNKILNSNGSYINHIDSDQIKKLKKTGFYATSNFEEISKVDFIIICVPTPLGVHNEPDLSYIEGTLNTLSKYFKQNQVLVLESTTYPGTTTEVLVDFIENKTEKKFVVGSNFFVGYSPEREDPGNKKFKTKDIPKIVSGHTSKCLSLVSALYNNIIDEIVPVSSTKVAEMTKILENIHRSVNIGLVNELKMVCQKMGIDIYEVINAAATKPFGFTPYYPGPGLGGHCIPIDPFYLTWKAKEFGMSTRFIELAGEINRGMPGYVLNRISEALNENNKSIKGSKILILGLAYKKNVDDLRESPSLEIMKSLISQGSIISFSDPYLKNIPLTRRFDIDVSSVEINKKNLKGFDLVLLATDHDDFDYDLIEKESKILVDTRGKFINSNPKVIKA